jgi:hypothetical protein
VIDNDHGSCGSLRLELLPIYDDICSGAIVPTTATNFALPFPVGATPVTYTAIDACGNVADSCNFTITINDNEAPHVASPND